MFKGVFGSLLFKIAKIIPKNHVYLTASTEEAGANHVVEGLACGLPILYHRNGGSIPEYVSEYGIEFWDNESLINAIGEMRKSFNIFKSRALSYCDSQEENIKIYRCIIENV